MKIFDVFDNFKFLVEKRVNELPFKLKEMDQEPLPRLYLADRFVYFSDLS